MDVFFFWQPFKMTQAQIWVGRKGSRGPRVELTNWMKMMGLEGQFEDHAFNEGDSVALMFACLFLMFYCKQFH